MSLDKPQAVPVDTHVLKIAPRYVNLREELKDRKSITNKEHQEIGEDANMLNTIKWY